MQNNTQRALRHTILPAVSSLLFFINAALPETVLGCANRGLVALALASISALVGLATVVIALKGRISGSPDSNWWILSTLILIIPVIALIKLA